MRSPVLAATSAYLVASLFGWRQVLSAGIRNAWQFYAVIAATLLAGVVVSFAGVSPIRLLFISGIIGGLATPISLSFLLIIGQSREVMKDRPIGKVLAVVGWLTVTIVAATSLYFLWKQFG